MCLADAINLLVQFRNALAQRLNHSDHDVDVERGGLDHGLVNCSGLGQTDLLEPILQPRLTTALVVPQKELAQRGNVLLPQLFQRSSRAPTSGESTRSNHCTTCGKYSFRVPVKQLDWLVLSSTKARRFSVNNCKVRVSIVSGFSHFHPSWWARLKRAVGESHKSST